MTTWKTARLRRLYGHPDDLIEANPDQITSTRQAQAKPAVAEPVESTPPPQPKRVKREKLRPESEYQLLHNMPVTKSAPDYSQLTAPLSEKQSGMAAYAIHSSRQNWLSGPMLETFWIRKPRGKKSADGQLNLREKMTKLHECSVTLGPHTFPVKLFMVRDDNVNIDEEEDKKVQEILDAEKKAKAEAERPTPTEEANKDTIESKDIPDNKDTTENKDITENKNLSENKDISVNKDSSEIKDISEKQNTAENNEDNKDVAENKDITENKELPNKNGGSTSIPDGKAVHSLNTERKAENDELEQLQPPVTVETSKVSDTENVSLTEETISSANKSQAAESAIEVNKKHGPPPTKKRARSKKSKVEASSTSKDTAATKPTFETEKEAIELQKKKNREMEHKLEQGKKNANRSAENPSEEVSEPTNSSKGTNEAESQSSTGKNVEAEQHSQVENNDQTEKHPEVEKAPETDRSSEANKRPENEQRPGQPPIEPSTANSFEAPKAPPNQLVVYRLQQMAARDPSLSELMKLVASGTAPPESIAVFQEIINRVKASLTMPAPSVSPAVPQKKKHASNAQSAKPPVQRPTNHTSSYQPRPNAKAIMLAIEFDESPAERYLFPKRSIIEFVPEKEEVLWSFLHVVDPPKNSKKRAKFTPITAVFHQIPLRIAQTMERCVRKQEIVNYYMKQIISSSDRTEPWNIWFQIEKNDEFLLDQIKKISHPVMPAPPAVKKPAKPRKPRGPSMAQIQLQRAHYDYMMWLERIKRGQPLPVISTVVNRVGQPLIQAPSFIFRPVQPIYGTVNNPNQVPIQQPAQFPIAVNSLGNSLHNNNTMPPSDQTKSSATPEPPIVVKSETMEPVSNQV